MPFTQPLPPFLEVQFVYSLPTGDCLNRFVFSCQDSATATDLNTWADAFTAAICSQWLLLWSDDLFMLGFFFKYRSTTDLYETVRGTGDTGAVNSEALAAQDVVEVDWFVSAATGGSRLARGRSGFSGCTEGNVTSGVLTAGFQSVVSDWALLLATPPVFGGSTPVFCIWRPTYNTMAPVNAGRVNPQLRTNRHRRVHS